MMVLNTVKTLSLVVDLIFLAVAVFAIIKAPFLKQPLFAGPLGDLVGGDDEDDAHYALEDAGGSTDGVVTLADAPFQNVNVNRLRDALYQAVAQQVLDLLSGSGIVNEILVGLHILDQPLNFFAYPQLFWGIVVFANIWKETGWNAIIYLAAITAIDPSLYEAAQIDGAGRCVTMIQERKWGR